MMSLAAGLGPTRRSGIDESFIGLNGVCAAIWSPGAQGRTEILQWIGIPDLHWHCPDQTLAKLANHIAKTAERKPGAQLSSKTGAGATWPRCPAQDLDDVLRATDVPERSGGGGAEISKRLRSKASRPCWTWSALDPATVRH